MWIYNDKVIKSPKTIEIGGVTYPRQIFKDKEFLLANGIKPYREVSVENKYYYNGTLTRVDNGSEVVGTYSKIPKNIDGIKEGMLSQLSQVFKNVSKRPRVTTSLGFDVDASRNDILNFEDGKALGVTTIKDADGNFHTITVADYDTIIAEQKASGLALYQTKWTKEAEIQALATIEDCILYEATPNGVDADGNVVYKNNITEW